MINIWTNKNLFRWWLYLQWIDALALWTKYDKKSLVLPSQSPIAILKCNLYGRNYYRWKMDEFIIVLKVRPFSSFYDPQMEEIGVRNIIKYFSATSFLTYTCSSPLSDEFKTIIIMIIHPPCVLHFEITFVD